MAKKKKSYKVYGIISGVLLIALIIFILHSIYKPNYLNVEYMKNYLVSNYNYTCKFVNEFPPKSGINSNAYTCGFIDKISGNPDLSKPILIIFDISKIPDYNPSKACDDIMENYKNINICKNENAVMGKSLIAVVSPNLGIIVFVLNESLESESLELIKSVIDIESS